MKTRLRTLSVATVAALAFASIASAQGPAPTRTPAPLRQGRAAPRRAARPLRPPAAVPPAR